MLTSFIIVTWNTRDLTLCCIQSIYEQESNAFEILVVDNNSQDDTCEQIEQKYPDVHLIRNDENQGYAKANNQGVIAAKGDLIILMNSDTELLTKDTIGKVISFFDMNINAGIAGACLLYPDGKVQACGRRFVTVFTLIKDQLLFQDSPLFKKSSMSDTIQSVDYVDGAFLAIRKKVVERIGLLNENYFMYAEDMEWCAAAHDAGWGVYVIPGIKVLHVHAASSKKSFRKILILNAINQSRFLYKRYNMFNAICGYIVLIVGMFLRIPVNFARRNGLTTAYAQAVVKCLQLIPVFTKLVTGELDETRCI